MQNSLNLPKYFLLSFSLFFSAFSLSASTKKLGDENRNKTLITPTAVEFRQLDKQINICTAAGFSFSLPKYEKVMVYLPTAVPHVGARMDSLENASVENLTEEIAQRQELKKLSKKLGLEVTQSEYIDLYREAADWLGTRYRMGSMSRKAVDCSGFTNIIYNTVFDKKLPRTSFDISNNLSQVLPIEELLPGDLVFFATRGKKRINHVGIYLGDGHFVHASIKGVKVSDLSDGYYKKTLRKAGRID